MSKETNFASIQKESGLVRSIDFSFESNFESEYQTENSLVKTILNDIKTEFEKNPQNDSENYIYEIIENLNLDIENLEIVNNSLKNGQILAELQQYFEYDFINQVQESLGFLIEAFQNMEQEIETPPMSEEQVNRIAHVAFTEISDRVFNNKEDSLMVVNEYIRKVNDNFSREQSKDIFQAIATNFNQNKRGDVDYQEQTLLLSGFCMLSGIDYEKFYFSKEDLEFETQTSRPDNSTRTTSVTEMSNRERSNDGCCTIL